MRTIEQRNRRFYRALYRQEVLEAMFRRYPKGSTIPKFRRKLRKIGFRIYQYIEVENFCQRHPEETRKLILDYYAKLKDDEVGLFDKSIYLMCLCTKENVDLFDMVLEEFKKYLPMELELLYTYDILSDLIYITKNIKYKELYTRQITSFGRYGTYLIRPGIYKLCGDFHCDEVAYHLKFDIEYNTNGKFHHAVCYALNKLNDNGKYDKILEKYDVTDIISADNIDFLNLQEKDEQIWKTGYDKDSTIPQFIEELEKENGSFCKDMDIRKYCQTHPLETKDLVIKFYKNSTLLRDYRFYLHCLKSEKNNELFPFLTEILNSLPQLYNGVINSINNFFYYTPHKNLEDKYIEIAQDKTINKHIWGVYEALIKIRSKKAKPIMEEIIKDDTDPRFYEALRYIYLSKDITEYEELFQIQKDNRHNSNIREISRKALKKIEKIKQESK